MLAEHIKSNTTDRYLKNLRDQLKTMIPEGSSVFEVGCGTGALLIDLADQISLGYGIDLKKGMINFANNNAARLNIGHIKFDVADASSINPGHQFDIGISVLCIHEINSDKRDKVLRNMKNLCQSLIICDFNYPKKILQQIKVHADEFLSGHHSRFRSYLKSGEIPGIISGSGLTVVDEFMTFEPSLKIWVIE